MLAEMTAAHRAPVHIWRRTDGRPGKLWVRECFLNGGGGEAAQKQRRCCVCLGVKGTFTDCTYVWGLRLSQGLWYDSGSLWILEGTWVRKRMNTAQHITTQHYTTTLDKHTHGPWSFQEQEIFSALHKRELPLWMYFCCYIIISLIWWFIYMYMYVYTHTIYILKGPGLRLFQSWSFSWPTALWWH